MDAYSERAEIEDVIAALLEASLATDANNTFVIRDGRHEMVTWSSTPALANYFGVPPTLKQYLDVLSSRNYSVLLRDGAALQMSYSFDGGELKKHRLCYIPNPLAVLQGEFSDFNAEEIVEVVSAVELRDRLVLESPVRFEYDYAAATEDHRAAHIHFTRHCCRVPMSRPIAVRQFIHFVMRHFYPDWYSAYGFVRETTPHIKCEDDLAPGHSFSMRVSVST